MNDKRIFELDPIEEVTGEDWIPIYQDSSDETKRVSIDSTGMRIKGDKGETGDMGAGLPTGGIAGEYLLKSSSDDYDYEWNVPNGGGNMLSSVYDPEGGEKQVSFSEDVVRPNLVDSIVYPVCIAHRGSPRLYPEESIESMRESTKDGYPIEIDLQALSDGTLVACHDTTVDRTMDNIQPGAVSSKTPQEWRNATIRPAIRGGRQGTPMFFEEYLNEFGGRYLLLPELKQEESSRAGEVIELIKQRNLERALIAQSFDYDVAKQFADAGIASMFLFNNTTTRTPASIYADGIEFVGGNKSMTNQTISSMKSAGLKVFVYTCNTQAEYNTAISRGVDGVFSDDPAYVSDNIKTVSSLDLSSGYGWAGMRARHTSGSNNSSIDPVLVGGSLAYSQTSAGIAYYRVPVVGKLRPPCRISMDFELGGNSTTDSNSVGILLINNTVDNEIDFLDQAVAGQEGFTVILRRTGQMQLYRYTEGGPPMAILAIPPEQPLAESGRPAKVTMNIEWTASTVRVSAPELGIESQTAASAFPQGLTLYARTSSNMDSKISNIQASNL